MPSREIKVASSARLTPHLNDYEATFYCLATRVYVVTSTAAVCGLAPMARTDARVLLLGSFPSAISLERKEYYANPRNQFWRIMGQLFEFDPTAPYSLRCQELLEHGIALWDVCKSARRSGSLDAQIDLESVVPNDLRHFLAEHRDIQLVAVNGRKAAEILDRLPLEHPSLRSRRLLPSTSPAHAAISVGEKVVAWSIVRDLNPSSCAL
jgi:double-stranded uracil-DNA glycosylase